MPEISSLEVRAVDTVDSTLSLKSAVCSVAGIMRLEIDVGCSQLKARSLVCLPLVVLNRNLGISLNWFKRFFLITFCSQMNTDVLNYIFLIFLCT